MNIAVIPGDGIGPEITEAVEQVLKRVCEIYGHVLNITHVKACSSSIEETGEPLPEESLKKCLQADAVLLGNTGLEPVSVLLYKLTNATSQFKDNDRMLIMFMAAVPSIIVYAVFSKRIMGGLNMSGIKG